MLLVPLSEPGLRIVGVTFGDCYSKYTEYGEWLRPDHLDLRSSGGNTVILEVASGTRDEDMRVVLRYPGVRAP